MYLTCDVVETNIRKDGECNSSFEKEGSNCKGARRQEGSHQGGQCKFSPSTLNRDLCWEPVMQPTKGRKAPAKTEDVAVSSLLCVWLKPMSGAGRPTNEGQESPSKESACLKSTRQDGGCCGKFPPLRLAETDVRSRLNRRRARKPQQRKHPPRKHPPRRMLR